LNLLLDTNAVLYFLKGDARVIRIVRDSDRLGISFITVIELLSFECAAEERKIIENFIQRLEVIYPDSETTRIVIDLRKTTRLKVPDCIIAAQAVQRGWTLATFDGEMIERCRSKVAICPMD
jgi:predicted nucleic acid-binding protein